MFRFRVAALLIAAGLAPLIHAADVISEEPTGALTLPEAWGLTLMHNPRLRVFSLEVRAAEARQLQASLRPNPTLEIEVEDFGGSGSMSGFDAAETSLLIRQPLELGGKREKRMQTAAVERALADVDYGIVRGEVRLNWRRRLPICWPPRRGPSFTGKWRAYPSGGWRSSADGWRRVRMRRRN